MFRYETFERLWPETIWYENQTPAQRELLKGQINFWRTHQYPTFKDLTMTDFEAGSNSVYHIGQMPIDTLFIGFAHLTPAGSALPLETLRDHFLNCARIAAIRITYMMLGRKINGEGLHYWQGIIDFEGDVGITPFTFDIPRTWGPRKMYLSPVWNRARAINVVREESVVPVLQYIPEPMFGGLHEHRPADIELPRAEDTVLAALVISLFEERSDEDDAREEAEEQGQDLPRIPTDEQMERMERAVRRLLREPNFVTRMRRIDRWRRRNRRRYGAEWMRRVDRMARVADDEAGRD